MKSAPVSPLGLIQESAPVYEDGMEWTDHGWRFLVVCALLRRSKGPTVRRVLPALFGACPTAKDVLRLSPIDIAALVKPCGLQNLHARAIVSIATHWNPKEKAIVALFPSGTGSGPYVRDAWEHLIRDRPYPVPPADHALTAWWYWRQHASDEVTIDGVLDRLHHLPEAVRAITRVLSERQNARTDPTDSRGK